MQTLVAVQALRAVAAIAVAMVHFSDIRYQLDGVNAQWLPLYPLASGVDLFFVISGFIMVYSSERLFAAPGGSWTFTTRRIARIVPLYWLVTLIAIPVMQRPATAATVAKSLLFIPYPDGVSTFVPLLGVGWTLNFEMLFYALFAVAVAWPRRTAVPALGIVLAGAVLTSALVPSLPLLLRYWSDPIVLEFVFGMTIAVLYRRKISLPIAARCCLLALAAVAVWFSAPVMPPSGYRALLWGCPAAAMVAGAVLGTPMRNTGQFAELLRLTGDSSYSIYLIHPLVGAAVLLSWHYSHFLFSSAVVCALGMAGSIGTAIFVFLLFERPTTVALRHLLGEHRPLPDGVLVPQGGHEPPLR
jgi:exopolysaccharide production protein ExoZ